MRLQIALVCVAGLAASASAVNIRTSNGGLGGGNGIGGGVDSPALWDQSAYDLAANALVDQEFSDFASFSTYEVDDFTTGGQTWNVDTIHTYFTNGNSWAGVTKAKVSFYPEAGGSPNGGDTGGNLGTVPVTVSNLGDHLEITANVSGLGALQGINGDFWIGLTPVTAFGNDGQNFHLQVDTIYNNESYLRNQGGGFGFGPDWFGADVINAGTKSDMAFKLDGTVVPAPGAFALMGLGGLIAGRRRRA